MKYIVTTQENGEEEIFIFPKSINHDCMAEAIQGIRNQSFGNWRRVSREPVSAGFIENGKCFGQSETLRLDSRDEDINLLQQIEIKEQPEFSKEIIEKNFWRLLN